MPPTPELAVVSLAFFAWVTHACAFPHHPQTHPIVFIVAQIEHAQQRFATIAVPQTFIVIVFAQSFLQT
jgi:hypothetical protein